MQPDPKSSTHVRTLGMMLLMAVASVGAVRAAEPTINNLNTVTLLSTTVPANGDVNPYGVAQIPRSHGNLIEGRFLISNFNNSTNAQGTGTTIVQIAPDGTFSQFAQIDAAKVDCP